MIMLCLPRSNTAMNLSNTHHVHGRPLRGEFSGLSRVVFGMGCFWGVERLFWSLPGVETTAAGYAGGHASAPTYRQVCGGDTGHAEVVLVVYDPARIAFAELLTRFWDGRDPTQGLRQGNAVGSPYRSVIHCHTQAQYEAALASRDAYQERLAAAGHGDITTEIVFPAPPFHYAEEEHQQYLSKNPGGYCGIGGTGVSCQVGVGA